MDLWANRLAHSFRDEAQAQITTPKFVACATEE